MHSMISLHLFPLYAECRNSIERAIIPRLSNKKVSDITKHDGDQ